MKHPSETSETHESLSNFAEDNIPPEKQKRKQYIRKVICVLLFAVICTSFAAAQSDEFGVSTNIAMILQFLASPWITGLACIALIVEAILLLTAGRSEPGMFKKFVPWIVGTIIFLSAGTITKKFIGESLSDSSRFTSELGID